MIRQIVGLDAEELVPRFYGFSRRSPRRTFMDFSMKPRDVAMRVVLNPNFKNNESYSDVRDELYKMISATRTGELILYFNAGATVVAKLEGFVTKFEAGYFNALPEVQITVRCEDPIFRGVAPVIYDLDSDEYPDPVIVDSYLQVPDSLSTAPHGLRIEGLFTDDIAGHGLFSIRNSESFSATVLEWEFRVSYAFDTGDYLTLISDTGDKNLYVTKADSSVVYLLDEISTITGASTWPLVFPGQNSMFFSHIDEGIFTVKHVEYYPTYWGV
jgi:hypothetical protein